MTRKYLDIDDALISVTKEGLKNFYWPSNRMHISSLQKEFTNNLVNLYQSYNDNDEIKLYLEILGLFWIRGIAHIGYNKYLADQFKSQDIDLHCGPRFKTLETLFNGNMPPFESYLQNLENGPRHYPRWRWPFRLLKQTFKPRKIKAHPITRLMDFSTPITCVISPLVHTYVEQSGKNAIYVETNSWFSKVSSKDIYSNDVFIQQLLTIAATCLQNFNIKCNQELLGWLHSHFIKSTSLAKLHAENLKKIRKLPKELWIGSSSAFWPRLLAREVLRRGGKVISFDHGSGSGQFQESALSKIITGCTSEFITYSENHAIEIRKSLATIGFGTHDIKVSSVTNFSLGQTKPPQHKTLKVKGRPKKTVMLLPLTLTGEIINMVPFPDDMIAQDLNVKLLKTLDRDGWKILLKPHPEFDFSKMQIFKNLFDVEILCGRFEEQAHLADVILFTHPATSTFLWAMHHHLNIVLLDFKITHWTETFKSKYKNKISLLDGYLEDNLRLSFDPATLLKTVNAAYQNKETSSLAAE